MIWFWFLQKPSRLARSYALFAFRLNFDPENHKIFFIGSVVQFDHFKLLPEAQQLRLNPGILWGSLKILQSSPPGLPKNLNIAFGPSWRRLSAMLARFSAILGVLEPSKPLQSPPEACQKNTEIYMIFNDFQYSDNSESLAVLDTSQRI